jgi:hypothetical protein
MVTIGDVANTSAIKAGHTGWYQAGVAAANIVKMVKDGEGAELDEYIPTKPMIKVTVGKVRMDGPATCDFGFVAMTDVLLIYSDRDRTSPSRKCGTKRANRRCRGRMIYPKICRPGSCGPPWGQILTTCRCRSSYNIT